MESRSFLIEGLGLWLFGFVEHGSMCSIPGAVFQAQYSMCSRWGERIGVGATRGNGPSGCSCKAIFVRRFLSGKPSVLAGLARGRLSLPTTVAVLSGRCSGRGICEVERRPWDGIADNRVSSSDVTSWIIEFCCLRFSLLVIQYVRPRLGIHCQCSEPREKR